MRILPADGHQAVLEAIQSLLDTEFDFVGCVGHPRGPRPADFRLPWWISQLIVAARRRVHAQSAESIVRRTNQICDLPLGIAIDTGRSPGFNRSLKSAPFAISPAEATRNARTRKGCS